jgi:hypothetical protein
MRIRPAKNHLLRQGHKVMDVTNASLLMQKARQRTSAGQSAQPITQRVIDQEPRLEFGREHTPRIAVRPPASRCAISVRPGEDILNKELTTP